MPIVEQLLPAKELQALDAKARAGYAKAIKAEIAVFQDAIRTRERMLGIVEGKTGAVPRTRAGNGAKATPRRRAARGRTRAPSGTLTAPMVIRAMRSGHDQTSAIAGALHSTPSTISRWMAKLERDGMVAKSGSGAQTRWALTDKGMRADP